MKALLGIIERVAKRNVTILVRGETGTGKELVARAIHAASKRASGPFRAINCAALPPDLLESQLFGHARGAFTGAVRDEPGHFRLAERGTLFLDEVSELSLPLQAKLLRVLQERSVIPVGGREPVPIDVRIVSATHRSLRAAVEAGAFRADLMYRLRVVPLRLSPLRERKADIALLADHFIERLNHEDERKVQHLVPAALHALEAYDWPGNIRELENALQYAFAMGDGPVITPAELPPEILGRTPDTELNIPTSPPADLPAEARAIVRALERAGGHKGRAAKSLGMSRTTFWRKLQHYELE